MQNLASNASGAFSAYTPTVTGSATTPVGTVSATSGPNSQPGMTLSSTGTSGGIEANTTVPVAASTMLGLSAVIKASSVSPNLSPFVVVFKDAAGNTVLTVTPVADAVPASTSAIGYNATVGVPDSAVSAVVSFANLHWASTGGYSCVLSSPVVLGY